MWLKRNNMAHSGLCDMKSSQIRSDAFNPLVSHTHTHTHTHIYTAVQLVLLVSPAIRL